MVFEEPLVSLLPISPPLNISIVNIVVEPTQSIHPNAENTTSARAAAQTGPRQNKSLLRKIVRAAKPPT